MVRWTVPLQAHFSGRDGDGLPTHLQCFKESILTGGPAVWTVDNGSALAMTLTLCFPLLSFPHCPH
jgi:hypothetical protein